MVVPPQPHQPFSNETPFIVILLSDQHAIFWKNTLYVGLLSLLCSMMFKLFVNWIFPSHDTPARSGSSNTSPSNISTSDVNKAQSSSSTSSSSTTPPVSSIKPPPEIIPNIKALYLGSFAWSFSTGILMYLTNQRSLVSTNLTIPFSFLRKLQIDQLLFTEETGWERHFFQYGMYPLVLFGSIFYWIILRVPQLFLQRKNNPNLSFWKLCLFSAFHQISIVFFWTVIHLTTLPINPIMSGIDPVKSDLSSSSSSSSHDTP